MLSPSSCAAIARHFNPRMIKQIKCNTDTLLKREIQKSRNLAEAFLFSSVFLFLLSPRYKKRTSQRFIIEKLRLIEVCARGFLQFCRKNRKHDFCISQYIILEMRANILLNILYANLILLKWEINLG